MHALNNLILFYNNCPLNELHSSVAKILLENIHTIYDKNIYDIAEMCHVSSATISRFCQRLGYSNFKEFKFELSTATENYHYLNQFVPITQLDENATEEETYFSMLEKIIKILSKNIDYSWLDMISEILHQYRFVRIYTHGVSLNEITLQSNLIMSGIEAKSCIFPPEQLAEADQLNEKTLVLLTLPNVPERTLGEKILKILKQNHVPIIILTNSRQSLYLKYADYYYCFDGTMTQIDDYYFTYLLSLLAMSYRKKYLPLVH